MLGGHVRGGRRRFGRVESAAAAAEAFGRVSQLIETMPDAMAPAASSDLVALQDSRAERLEREMSAWRSTWPGARRLRGW